MKVLYDHTYFWSHTLLASSVYYFSNQHHDTSLAYGLDRIDQLRVFSSMKVNL